MRLAVSNIAWPVEADERVATTLKANGVEGIEIAPTKYWPEPLKASSGSMAARRRWWEDRGLKIIAMQALLYGRNDLTIFDDFSTRGQTWDYLYRIMDLAAELGAGTLVFGSPKNRQRGGLSPAQAEEIAIPFFRELGRHAHSRGIEFCLEANPVEYGGDFVVNSEEAMRFVTQVGQPGFGLHLDVGGMILANDPFEATFLRAMNCCRHFHVSEPYLAPVGTMGTPHAEVSRALHKAGYRGWVSLEMKQADEGTGWLDHLVRSVQFVQTTYRTHSLGREVA